MIIDVINITILSEPETKYTMDWAMLLEKQWSADHGYNGKIWLRGMKEIY